jgi:hypothetical protein
LTFQKGRPDGEDSGKMIEDFTGLTGNHGVYDSDLGSNGSKTHGHFHMEGYPFWEFIIIYSIYFSFCEVHISSVWLLVSGFLLTGQFNK